jgi:hypothetical protein
MSVAEQPAPVSQPLPLAVTLTTSEAIIALNALNQLEDLIGLSAGQSELRRTIRRNLPQRVGGAR